jgi:hypothetical protein
MTSDNHLPEPGRQLKVVFNPATHEWLVAENGTPVCTLRKTVEKSRWELQGSHGAWLIERQSSSRLSVCSASQQSRTAEIRVGVYKHGPFGEDPETYTDLYVDRCTYRQVEGGVWTVAEYKGRPVFRYNGPWRDRDISDRVRFILEFLAEVPADHHDLLCVMPLFWSGAANFPS